MIGDDPMSIGVILDGYVDQQVGQLSDRALHDPTRIGAAREPLPLLVHRAVRQRDRDACRWCKHRRTYASPLQADHILPWSAGGADHPVNLRILCQDCNRSRSNRLSSRDQRQLPIVIRCRRCDLTVVPGAPEVDAFCLDCDAPGPAPYLMDLLIGGPTPKVGLPPALPGLRDGAGLVVAHRPPAAAGLALLTARCDAQAVTCPWCQVGPGQPCIGPTGPLVRSPAHPARQAAARGAASAAGHGQAS